MAVSYHVERHIDAPPERVWTVLTDAAGYRDWNPTIVSIDSDMRVGSTVRLVSTLAPKRTFTLRVTEASPPNLMAWSDRKPLGLFTGVRTFRLAARNGGTDFAMTEMFSGPLAGLITKAIPDMTESFQQFADGLKTAAEEPR
jgi:uncharacterized protein YndB with AHSA1/START domain